MMNMRPGLEMIEDINYSDLEWWLLCVAFY